MISFRSTIGIIGILLSIPSLAQNVLIQSESAFGKLTIFADHAASSETFYHNGKEIHVEEIGYTHNQIDSILLNINYDCFLAFEDNTNEGIRDTNVYKLGNGTPNSTRQSFTSQTRYCSSVKGKDSETC